MRKLQTPKNSCGSIDHLIDIVSFFPVQLHPIYNECTSNTHTRVPPNYSKLVNFAAFHRIVDFVYSMHCNVCHISPALSNPAVYVRCLAGVERAYSTKVDVWSSASVSRFVEIHCPVFAGCSGALNVYITNGFCQCDAASRSATYVNESESDEKNFLIGEPHF